MVLCRWDMDRYVKNERMHYEKEVRKLICALQKCVDQEYNEDFADVETLGGWLSNLLHVPCPQSLVIEAQQRQQPMDMHKRPNRAPPWNTNDLLDFQTASQIVQWKLSNMRKRSRLQEVQSKKNATLWWSTWKMSKVTCICPSV